MTREQFEKVEEILKKYLEVEIDNDNLMKIGEELELLFYSVKF